jgi:uroporphyrinogen-III synthase
MPQPAVLLTRPLEDSLASAAALAERGVGAVIAPLLDIVPHEDPPPLSGVQALLITSANGIRAFAQQSERRDLPVYAVGDASAQMARTLGFTTVESAAGAVDDLAALVRQRLDPQAGMLLHPAGSALAGDLAGQLAQEGFAVRRYQAYAARPVAALPEPARQALTSGEVQAVLLYSPRTAAQFRALVTAAGLAAACRPIDALCLSAAVAEALEPLAFCHIRVAERPEQPSLFDLLA